jgi:glucosamine 6-phosphate synthetase-like amidotransferase/phosphosugar isomerase protein
MADYIETQTKDGSTIRIEVADTSKAGVGFSRSATATQISTEETKDAYDQLLTTIRHCANGVIETLQNLEALPNSASIDFAVKIDAEAGAMVAKSREDAQFRVSLSWKQAEPEKKDNDD